MKNVNEIWTVYKTNEIMQYRKRDMELNSCTFHTAWIHSMSYIKDVKERKFTKVIHYILKKN